jgi:hypothetical protein
MKPNVSRFGRWLAVVLFIASLVALVSIALAADFRGDTSDPPPADDEEPPSPSDYEWAVEELEAERQRVSEAREEWVSVSSTSPDKVRSMIVSLPEPVPLGSVLSAMGEGEEVELKRLHIWMQVPNGGVAPHTGEVSWERLGEFGTSIDELSSGLREYLAEGIERHRQAISDVANSATAEDQAAMQRQMDQLGALREHIHQNGAYVYGFECGCSPNGLIAAWPGLQPEAGNGVVEILDDLAPVPYQPIWPEDPQRDAVLDAFEGAE